MRTERIAERMAELGMSQADLARRVGVSQPAIQQVLNGRTGRSRVLPEIAQQLGVSVSYLLGDTDDPAAVDVPRPLSPDDMAAELGVARVRQVPVEYGMGGGTYIEDYVEEQWSFFDAEWLREITETPPSSLFVARGVGDSMMPTLLDSDTLLVDRSQRTVKQQDRIWALTYGEVGMIKRIRRLPHGKYLVMSDSPHVSDFDAPDEDIHIIGRVVWIGRKA
jgi:phage repressor protein C with HTH and peptisase S24 domain